MPTFLDEDEGACEPGPLHGVRDRRCRCAHAIYVRQLPHAVELVVARRYQPRHQEPQGRQEQHRGAERRRAHAVTQDERHARRVEHENRHGSEEKARSHEVALRPVRGIAGHKSAKQGEKKRVPRAGAIHQQQGDHHDEHRRYRPREEPDVELHQIRRRHVETAQRRVLEAERCHVKSWPMLRSVQYIIREREGLSDGGPVRRKEHRDGNRADKTLHEQRASVPRGRAPVVELKNAHDNGDDCGIERPNTRGESNADAEDRRRAVHA